MQKLIDIAAAEVGYLEKASLSNLDDKTTNAGHNNFTKYARDIDKIDGLLNGRKQGYAWCTIFVLWCLMQRFGADALRGLCYLPEKSLAAGCIYAVKYYKATGAYSQSPQVGDQVFFKDSAGEPCHTGIVIAVDGNTITTIEGNTSSEAGVVDNGGCVAQKRYARTYSRIHGYGHPNYIKYLREEINMTRAEVEQLINEHTERIVRTILSGAGTEPSDWAVDELAEAQRLGITDGTRPKGYAKREEVAAMILRAVTAKSDSDRELPPEAAEAMTNGSY